MEKYIWLYAIIGIVLIAALFRARSVVSSGGINRKEYDFARRDYIMTQAEAKLFRRLETIAGDRYYVFPQVHLSSLLDHRVRNGQSWRGALSKIQRKSVDFVLVDKTSLRTMYAVELDDRTHDRPDRQERDDMVARCLLDVDIPLVRLHKIDAMSDDDIESAFRSAHNRREQTT